MTKQFDLVVLGTGAGAAAVVTRCREAGWSVAVVDSRPYGGTCALRGCDPKKALVEIAGAVDAVRRLRGKGVAGEVQVRWSDLMRFKRSFTEPVPAARERALDEAEVATLHGVARFVGPTSLEVGGERIEAKHVHIATGAKPVDLPIPGKEHLTTSDAFLELDELPRRIVFLGSGFIAFEFAHVAASAGAQVVMLERLEQPLAGFDPDLVTILAERTRSMGVDLRVGTTVESIERGGQGALLVRAKADQGRGPVELEADMVVHSAGRVPKLDKLNLQAAGVQHDERGVLVNEYMQSVSNPAVYSAGDVVQGGLALTPVASFEAHVAAANLLEGNHRKVEYPPIPSVVFTLPSLASVGMLEAEARSKGFELRVNHAITSSWYSSRRLGEEYSGYKILTEERTGKILGAHLLGPRAEEVINVFAMAMRCGMTSRELKKGIFAYPTLGSDIPYML